MNGTTRLREPAACPDDERRDFARLVRDGFGAVPETLDGRIGDARLLAFHHPEGDGLGAIAALKSPTAAYRSDAFRKAGAPVEAGDYPLELGWVFVVPAHRRRGIAGHLCRELLARATGTGVFSTTRPDNAPMIRILTALGFARIGTPYPRRDEELILFLRASGPP